MKYKSAVGERSVGDPAGRREAASIVGAASGCGRVPERPVSRPRMVWRSPLELRRVQLRPQSELPPPPHPSPRVSHRGQSAGEVTPNFVGRNGARRLHGSAHSTPETNATRPHWSRSHRRRGRHLRSELVRASTSGLGRTAWTPLSPEVGGDARPRHGVFAAWAAD